MSNVARDMMRERLGADRLTRIKPDYQPYNLPAIVPTVKQFTGSDPRHCAVFGCNKVLTLVESLAGTKCLDHQGSERVDVMRVVRLR